MMKSPPLPDAWTDLSNGATRTNVDNMLQFSAVTVYFDKEPVAVLLSIEKYKHMLKAVNEWMKS